MSATVAGHPDTAGQLEFFHIRAAVKRALLTVILAWIPQSWCEQIVRWAKPVAQWWWRTWWRRMTIRITAAFTTVVALALVLAPRASANASDVSAAASFFSWMKLYDSHGISAWLFHLSIDRGNTTPGGAWRTLWSWTITLGYEVYRFVVTCAIWLISWVLSFEWVDLILAPLKTISEALTSITHQFALMPFVLTLAGVSIGIWLLRGRFATGLYELLVSSAIAAAAVGVLANPFNVVAGEDGLIKQARDFGIEMAAGIANDGDTTGSAEKQLKEIETKLVDVFVRQPTQMINFGVVLDAPSNGGKCVAEFDAAYRSIAEGSGDPSLANQLRDGLIDSTNIPGVGTALDAVLPGGEDKPEDKVKNAISDCEGDNGPMKAFADNPGPGQAIGVFFLIIGAFALLAFAVVLAFGVLLAVGIALGNALKAIVGVTLAIAPAMRGQLWRSIANTAMSLMQLVFSIVFLVAYLLVIAELFSSDELGLFQVVFFVDIALVAGLLLFRRGMNSLRKFSDILAAKMATRPGASPTAISKSSPSTAVQLAHAAYTTRQVARGGKALAKGAGKLASTGGKATVAGSTAATGGLVAAGLLAKNAITKTKSKIGSASDPEQQDPQESGTDSGATQRGASNQTPAERLRGRLSEADVAGKAGVKRPLTRAGQSPTTVAAARGSMRPGTETVRGNDGRSYRRFTTQSGASIMLPTQSGRTPTQPSPAVKPSSASVAKKTAPNKPAQRAPRSDSVRTSKSTRGRSRNADLVKAASRAKSSNPIKPASLSRGR